MLKERCVLRRNVRPGCVEKIEDEVFKLLMEEWTDLQGNFVSSLQQLFNWHRCHLADFRGGLFGMKTRFAEFLQRTDGKQDMVDDFASRPGRSEKHLYRS